MAGILASLFDGWAANRQRKEMEVFVVSLQAMARPELGMLVAAATDIKNGMREHGYNLDDPFMLTATDPGITYEFSSRCVRLQREDRLAEVAALMVWVHTLRAASRPELRGLGRSMWAELGRGFPFVEIAAEDIHAMFGKWPEVTGADIYPIGLEPEPL